ncbi:tyrosine-protein kinase Fes/Fps-like [Myotis lucifugus]|uniref:tyrosine-protein kinase Fes/Fps-like n=1 Tax=Myotis lucifugus TaxID=59463 RepID=UPI000CCC7F31|nr:tyrosine-protein kinase Fes/Fps-like [Myotis lucifugus]
MQSPLAYVEKAMGETGSRFGRQEKELAFQRVEFGVQRGAFEKEILQEYLEISSLVQDEVAAIHQEMAAAAARIQPEAEYHGFLRQHG